MTIYGLTFLLSSETNMSVFFYIGQNVDVPGSNWAIIACDVFCWNAN